MLLRDGCVELPALGWLYFITCPASVSDRGFTVNPPFRKLVFSPSRPGTVSPSASVSSVSPEASSSAFSPTLPNGTPSNGTPSIVLFYAEANGLSVRKATEIITGCVSAIGSLVSSSRDFLLPGLGRFKRMRDGTLYFVQDQELELCPAFDFLPSLSLKTHSRDLAPDSSEPTVPSEPSAPTVPSEAAAPSEPSEPSEPTEPSEADAPSEPSEPSEPTEPSEPAAPSEAAAPSEPSVPSEPSDSSAPAEPADGTGLPEAKPGRRPSRTLRTLAICSGSLLLAALLFLSALAIVGRVAPDLIDSYLYTAEQIDILHGNF